MTHHVGSGGDANGGTAGQYGTAPSALSTAAMVAAATATATATASVVALQERQDMNQQFGQVSSLTMRSNFTFVLLN
jgi:hypothetical protein